MVGKANPKIGVWAGPLGNPGTPIPQKGIIAFSLSPNRQRILAGTAGAAVFNTFRRSRQQLLYVAPPFVIAYTAMNWAIERNEYLNSKPGREAEGEE
ncbi:putative ubiquinol-cytochrome C reductase complex subunit UcrQ [Talaromyces proteolyticus]|uniref:Cytochrome b-c1 complex subunit 8 n=1 Tax=Talaromyces proteolyticus TaxID=1131652 RepID=A0AAD4KXX9_9EURO|nr:putative ubiquinol-cytochrome C reductase complex subunit UcrQ [Talaromyces proteolyticus]KAH8698541.1 putative ubiquinol-cytochrome C reductase complex subunit UcrQ [Talaromyces proteolyticus]